VASLTIINNTFFISLTLTYHWIYIQSQKKSRQSFVMVGSITVLIAALVLSDLSFKVKLHHVVEKYVLVYSLLHITHTLVYLIYLFC